MYLGLNFKKVRNSKLLNWLFIGFSFLLFQNCSKLDQGTLNQSVVGDRFPSSEGGRSKSTTCSPTATVAFPEALGFGKNTRGGRGGRIVHVTNLKESGVGSLRWALEDIREPRIVVFDGKGRIFLTKEIRIIHPFITIAGQTAPGEGVVISGARINVSAKEVIIRGIKARAGDDPRGDTPKNRDNLAIGGNGDKREFT